MPHPSNPSNPSNPLEHDCSDCPLTGRRDFFARAGLVIAGVVAGRIAGAQSLRAAGHEVTYPLPAADGASVDKDNEVILVRSEGAVYAFALSCPHQNTALKWLDDAHVFQCPKHKSRYKPDGTFISGRATRGMDRLPIRRKDQTVIVTTDVAFQQDKEPERWGAAVVKL